MAEFDMRFSSRIIVGTVSGIGASVASWGDRALLLADSAMESAAAGFQERLDSWGIDTILFAKEGLGPDTVGLEEALSLARGSHAAMVVGFGGEDIISLARLTAAFAPGTQKAVAVFGGASGNEAGLPVLEIPVKGRHELLFRDEAFLSDYSTGRTVLVSLLTPPSRTVVMDASLAGRFSRDDMPADLADLLATAAESYLSPRSSFLSDVQSSAALGALASLIRDAKEHSSDPEFRSKMIEASVLCSFSSGLTAQGPVSLLSWAVAGVSGLSKAAVSAVLLPWILESPFYSGSPKSRGLSRLLADPEGGPTDRPVDDVRALFGRLGLPGRLGDLGAELSEIMPASEWAADMLESDRTDLDEAAFRDILETSS